MWKMLGDIQNRYQGDSWRYKSGIQKESLDQIQSIGVIRMKVVFKALEEEREKMRS